MSGRLQSTAMPNWRFISEPGCTTIPPQSNRWTEVSARARGLPWTQAAGRWIRSHYRSRNQTTRFNRVGPFLVGRRWLADRPSSCPPSAAANGPGGRRGKGALSADIVAGELTTIERKTVLSAPYPAQHEYMSNDENLTKKDEPIDTFGLYYTSQNIIPYRIRKAATLEDERELLRGNTPTMILAILRDGPQHAYAIGCSISERAGE